MNRFGWGAVAGFGVAGLLVAAPPARPGEAAQTNPPGKTSAAAAAAKNEVTGTVEKFDRATRTLTLANSDKKLTLTDDTEVSKEGQKVSPGQIVEGDQVRASYSASGDTLRVERLEVITGSTGKAARGAKP